MPNYIVTFKGEPDAIAACTDALVAVGQKVGRRYSTTALGSHVVGGRDPSPLRRVAIPAGGLIAMASKEEVEADARQAIASSASKATFDVEATSWEPD